MGPRASNHQARTTQIQTKITTNHAKTTSFWRNVGDPSTRTAPPRPRFLGHKMASNAMAPSTLPTLEFCVESDFARISTKKRSPNQVWDIFRRLWETVNFQYFSGGKEIRQNFLTWAAGEDGLGGRLLVGGEETDRHHKEYNGRILGQTLSLHYRLNLFLFLKNQKNQKYFKKAN